MTAAGPDEHGLLCPACDGWVFVRDADDGFGEDERDVCLACGARLRVVVSDDETSVTPKETE